MTSERVLGIRCRCGGKLKKTATEVEFFGIDFWMKEAEVCTECGSEYLSQELMKEIESEV
ncbi:MAG TPA: hypothetical protein VGR53_09335 [Nitrososphaerales archaeon]|nr:hypothetical protein [Nitrososphaerales archaeon]